MYCLPDPQDGDKRNLVPVLLGMDHLSGKDAPESALTIDFHTGLAIEIHESPTSCSSTSLQQKGSLCAGHCGLLDSGFQM